MVDGVRCVREPVQLEELCRNEQQSRSISYRENVVWLGHYDHGINESEFTFPDDLVFATGDVLTEILPRVYIQVLFIRVLLIVEFTVAAVQCIQLLMCATLYDTPFL